MASSGASAGHECRPESPPMVPGNEPPAGVGSTWSTGKVVLADGLLQSIRFCWQPEAGSSDRICSVVPVQVRQPGYSIWTEITKHNILFSTVWLNPIAAT